MVWCSPSLKILTSNICLLFKKASDTIQVSCNLFVYSFTDCSNYFHQLFYCNTMQWFARDRRDERSLKCGGFSCEMIFWWNLRIFLIQKMYKISDEFSHDDSKNSQFPKKKSFHMKIYHFLNSLQANHRKCLHKLTSNYGKNYVCMK